MVANINTELEATAAELKSVAEKFLNLCRIARQTPGLTDAPGPERDADDEEALKKKLREERAARVRNRYLIKQKKLNKNGIHLTITR